MAAKKRKSQQRTSRKNEPSKKAKAPSSKKPSAKKATAKKSRARKSVAKRAESATKQPSTKTVAKKRTSAKAKAGATKRKSVRTTKQAAKTVTVRAAARPKGEATAKTAAGDPPVRVTVKRGQTKVETKAKTKPAPTPPPAPPAEETGLTSAISRLLKKRDRDRRPAAPGHSELVLLGTGTPGPDPERHGSSLAIVVNDQPYIVDFGPGVVRRTAGAQRRGVRGLAAHRLTRAFLTHLHSDHTAGYPDLILMPWVCGRSEPLRVVGPPGLQHMTDHLLAAYEQDIDQRLNGLETSNEVGYQVEVTEVQPEGVVYEDANVIVEAFPVSHGYWPAYGYKFICPDRTIVVSGDTNRQDTVIEAAKGCDILVHEVCSGVGLSMRSPEWQRYHSNYHTLGHELSEIAAKAKPGLLVLTHQLLQGVSESDLLREVRSVYDGAVVSGRDLDIL